MASILPHQGSRPGQAAPWRFRRSIVTSRRGWGGDRARAARAYARRTGRS
ncbi:hypothetical protein KBZ94_03640 [Streptomyces sp. RM72]|nr:hypothetical protein [Streptomyces sp. RM72]MBQ0884029.1 hypothetical protein [Streptomyces sp. RM72]